MFRQVNESSLKGNRVMRVTQQEELTWAFNSEWKSFLLTTISDIWAKIRTIVTDISWYKDNNNLPIFRSTEDGKLLVNVTPTKQEQIVIDQGLRERNENQKRDQEEKERREKEEYKNSSLWKKWLIKLEKKKEKKKKIAADIQVQKDHSRAEKQAEENPDVIDFWKYRWELQVRDKPDSYERERRVNMLREISIKIGKNISIDDAKQIILSKEIPGRLRANLINKIWFDEYNKIEKELENELTPEEKVEIGVAEEERLRILKAKIAKEEEEEGASVTDANNKLNLEKEKLEDIESEILDISEELREKEEELRIKQGKIQAKQWEIANISENTTKERNLIVQKWREEDSKKEELRNLESEKETIANNITQAKANRAQAKRTATQRKRLLKKLEEAEIKVPKWKTKREMFLERAKELEQEENINKEAEAAKAVAEAEVENLEKRAKNLASNFETEKSRIESDIDNLKTTQTVAQEKITRLNGEAWNLKDELQFFDGEERILEIEVHKLTTLIQEIETKKTPAHEKIESARKVLETEEQKLEIQWDKTKSLKLDQLISDDNRRESNLKHRINRWIEKKLSLAIQNNNTNLDLNQIREEVENEIMANTKEQRKIDQLASEALRKMIIEGDAENIKNINIEQQWLEIRDEIGLEQEITQEVINESMEALLGGATEPEIVRVAAE